MNTKVYNLIILDESGSMERIKEQTISGFNETIQTITVAQKKHEDQQHFVSLVVFNSDSIRTVFDKVSIEAVPELTYETYRPNCCTPLYDALGIALNNLRYSLVDADGCKVLVTIITDGEENSSSEYDGKMIKLMVEELKATAWVFTYIGANQNVDRVAGTISVTNVMSFESTPHGTKQMFAKESASRMRWFDKLSKDCNNLADNFFDDEK